MQTMLKAYLERGPGETWVLYFAVRLSIGVCFQVDGYGIGNSLRRWEGLGVARAFVFPRRDDTLDTPISRGEPERRLGSRFMGLAMPPWLLKLPALIRAYGPTLIQAYWAVSELVTRWRKKGEPVPEKTEEDKDG